jgi:hypothetical protein
MKTTFIFLAMFFAINLYSNPSAKKAMDYQKCAAESQNKMMELCTGAKAAKNTKKCKELQIAILECSCKHLDTGCDELEKLENVK